MAGHLTRKLNIKQPAEAKDTHTKQLGPNTKFNSILKRKPELNLLFICIYIYIILVLFPDSLYSLSESDYILMSHKHTNTHTAVKA